MREKEAHSWKIDQVQQAEISISLSDPESTINNLISHEKPATRWPMLSGHYSRLRKDLGNFYPSEWNTRGKPPCISDLLH